MNSKRDEGRERGGKELTPIACDSRGRSEQRACGSGAECHYHLRFYGFDLLIKPHPAREYLFAIRLLVNSALAARLPLEMFNRVRQVNLSRIEAGFDERLAQQLPRWTDERFAGEVFLIAGLLADEHETRAWWTLAEHGLSAAFPKVAPSATCRALAQRRKFAWRPRFR